GVLYMKIKKLVIVLAATTLLAGALAACSSTPKNAEPKPTLSADVQGSENANPYLASEKPLKLTVHMGTKDSGVFKNDWAIFKKAAELTNVTLEGTLPSTVADFSETFSI